MFSRVGKQTIAEALCFQSQDEGGVQSTFAKERMNNAAQEDEYDDEEEIEAELWDIDQTQEVQNAAVGTKEGKFMRDPQQNMKTIFEDIEVS